MAELNREATWYKNKIQAATKYNAKTYANITVRVYRGQEELVRDYASQKGETVNGLINRLLTSEIPGFVPIKTNH